jgi:hypothetical protein
MRPVGALVSTVSPTAAAVPNGLRVRRATKSLLRYVEVRGDDLGRKQVRKGWASVYVYDEPFHRLGSYRDAARKPRKKDRGVWELCGGSRQANVARTVLSNYRLISLTFLISVFGSPPVGV